MSYHLKLVKGRSYYGCGVYVTESSRDAYVEDKAVADYLVESGYFELMTGGTENEPDEETSANGEDGKILEDMNTSEIETYATYNGISLKGIKKKADMIAKLREELGAEAEGKVTYGSPTMVELQEE